MKAPSLPDDLMVAPWLYPHALAYLPIYVLWQDREPVLSGRLTMALFISTRIFPTWALACDRQRSLIA